MAVAEAFSQTKQTEVKGRVLIVTAGLSGLLYSSVELARRLADAGHKVTYAAPVAARELVQHHDLEFSELEPSRYEEFLARDSCTGRLHRFRDLQRRRIEATRSLGLAPFVEAVRDLDPDLLLIDGEMHEQILAASACGVPMALLNTFPSIWRRPGLPPTHTMIRPGVGWKGSALWIAASWFVLRLRKWRRAAVQRVRHVGCDRVSMLRHLAQEAGFDLGRETDSSQWLIPFTYRRFPYLSLHALEFEFPHQPAANVRYVGPMVLADRADAVGTRDSRAELETILERRRGSRGQTRLIYAGFGSVFSTDVDFVRRLGGVVAERPGWELIVSLSRRVKPASLGSLPERVHVLPWVPQIRVLQHADAVVTHGGLNTLDECVLHSVPVLVYGGGETDMAGNTARVVHHGIGIAGNREQDSTADIRRQLDRLLHEPGFPSNLSRLRQQYAAYERERVAETVVQSLIRDGSLPPAASTLAGTSA